MGIKTPRKKPFNLLLSIIYRLNKILPISKKTKLKFFLNLEWIFDRLSHELSFDYYSPSNHPFRQYSKDFILNRIKETDIVLDLGCGFGDISVFIAEKAKEVIGIDHEENEIKIANKQYVKANLKFYHREALEFLQENSVNFDVLILSHVLEHLDDPKEFLLNFKKYFNLIYIELPDFDRYYLNHYRKDLNLSLIYSDNDHITEFDRVELKALLAECGIEIIEEEYKYGVQKLWCIVQK